MIAYLCGVRRRVFYADMPLVLFGFIVYVTYVSIAYKLSGDLNGPFIFNDEVEYHWLAYEIYDGLRLHSHQYNPLYPAVISWTFIFDGFDAHHSVIRLFNIMLFGLILFPSYGISVALGNGKRKSALIAVVILLSPIGSYQYMTWGEPLFYPLITLGYYTFIIFLNDPRCKYSFGSGFVVGLAYLTKQASLFVFLPMLILLLLNLSKRFCRERVCYLLAFLSGFILVFSLWSSRNALSGDSIVGYADTFGRFYRAVIDEPYHYTGKLLDGIGMSMSYSVLLYAGIILCLFRMFPVSARNADTGVLFGVTFVAVIHFVLLVVVSESLLVPYNLPISSVGRYTDVLMPVIVAISGVYSVRDSSNKYLITSIVFFLAIAFSPWSQVKAFASTTNSAVSVLNIFWNEFLWDTPKYSRLHVYLLALFMALLSYVIMHLRRVGFYVLCFWIMLLGVVSHTQVVRLGATVKPYNDLMIYLNNNGLDIRNIYIDSAMYDTGMIGRVGYWYPHVFKSKVDMGVNDIASMCVKRSGISYYISSKIVDAEYVKDILGIRLYVVRCV